MIKNLKIIFYKENSSKYRVAIDELINNTEFGVFMLEGNQTGYNVTPELHGTLWYSFHPKEIIRVMHGITVGSVKKKISMVLILYCPDNVDIRLICSSIQYVISEMNIKIIVVVDGKDIKDKFCSELNCVDLRKGI